MEKVSLTYFLDFMCKVGTPKVTVVRDFKTRDKYDPRTDFYKPIRDRIVAHFKEVGSLDELEAWAGTVDKKKREAYHEIVSGLRKFLGRKKVEWFEPPKRNFDIGPITVSVNPELGLKVDGHPYVLKLFFKDEEEDSKKTKHRVQVILHIMRQALHREDKPRMFSVLDVRRGKLLTEMPPTPTLQALLVGEASSFAAIFDEL